MSCATQQSMENCVCSRSSCAWEKQIPPFVELCFFLHSSSLTKSLAIKTSNLWRVHLHELSFLSYVDIASQVERESVRRRNWLERRRRRTAEDDERRGTMRWMLMETFETQSHRLMSFFFLLFPSSLGSVRISWIIKMRMLAMMMMKIDYWQRVRREGKVSLAGRRMTERSDPVFPLIIFNGKNQSQSDSGLREKIR